AWVDHGFAVVLVNYRGSSGYGKAWRDAIVGRPGLTELEDLARVHDRLTAQGIVDPARTILSGGSWGGYLTLLGLGVQPERWALGKPYEEYRYDAGHGSLVIDEQLKQVTAEIAFAARHLGTQTPIA